jgi:two-component system, OmpR family, sensor kinase
MSGKSRVRNTWRFVVKLPGRTPLRAKLIVAELALVAIAMAVLSVIGLNTLRGYLLHQQDQAVTAQAYDGTVEINSQNYLDGEFTRGPKPHHVSTRISADWVGAGKVFHVIYPVSGYSLMGFALPIAGPNVPTNPAWLQASKPEVVSAASGNGHWDVIGVPLAAVTPHGVIDGTLVVGLNVTPVYNTIAKLARVDIAVSAILLAAALAAGLVAMRRSLRPLNEIKLTADAVAAGDLAQRVPELDPRTEFGGLGRSLNRMLGHIESRVHARSGSEHAARRSEERMRRLLTDVSHELRTPLTAIRGVAEYYRHRSASKARDYRRAGRSDTAFSGNEAHPAGGSPDGAAPTDLEKVVYRVEQESRRMADLVEDLLVLGQLDQHGVPETWTLDLQTLATDAVQAARAEAQDRGIDLIAGDADPLEVNGDSARLRQALDHLIGNARSRAPDGTNVEVRIRPARRAELPDEPAPLATGDDEREGAPEHDSEPSMALIEVTDHGAALTDEQITNAFERVYRHGYAKDSAGSGLGLAIVAAIAAAHGGAAWVAAERVHQTTFCVAFPLRRTVPEAGQDERPSPGFAEIAAAMTPLAEPGQHHGPGVSDVWGAAPSNPDGWLDPGPVDEISFLCSGPQGRPRGGHGGLTVGGAEQADVHEQRVQLVQRDAVAPAVRERPDLLVAAPDQV